ncbi:MAG: S41 family peptidase [Candidatus Cloacimonetes bacterium]|nr:S41 family peptidase [Candidatus Cloacimonadota bacterium]
MKKSLLMTLLVLMEIAGLYAVEPAFVNNPAISPDGTQICFCYDTDLWVMPFKGGVPRRLTKTASDEWNPQWSPDGSMIAFSANREGSSYVYIMSAEGGEARVVTRESMGVSDWFNDSKYLLCTKHSLRWGRSFYKVPLDGSRPELIAEIGNSYASLSPDNTQIVFQQGGYPDREAYRGSANGELWLLDIASKKYTNLSNTDYSELYPRYSHYSNSLFYCGAKDEQLQLMRVDKMNFKKPVILSKLGKFSARDITVARTNDRVVFTVFDALYTYDPTKIGGNPVTKLKIDLASDDWQDTIVRSKMKNEFDMYAVSPDELLLGFNYKYDSFLMPRKGGEAKQFTFDHNAANSMQFLDKRKLIISKLDAGKNKLFSVDVDSLQTTVKPIAWFGADSLSVEDVYMNGEGRWTIMYADHERGRKVAVADSGFVNIRPLDTPWAVNTGFVLNKAGTYAVYGTVRDDDYIRELYLLDMKTGENRRLLADDAWISSLSWTHDNKSILLSRNSSIYRLDLVPRDEFEYEKDNWKEVFAPAKEKPDTTKAEIKDDDNEDFTLDIVAEEVKPEAIPTQLHIVWEGLDKRYYPVIPTTDAYLFVFSVIDDSTFYYIEHYGKQDKNSSLKKANIYGNNIKEEFSFGKQASSYTLVAKTIYYLEGSKLKSYNMSSSARKEIVGELDYQYDKTVLNSRVFEQVWGAFGDNFYDPDMHGKNWNQQYQLYRPYVDKARSIDDVATIIDEMIGDVNASHTGFYPRQEESRFYNPLAYIGAEWDYQSLTPEGIKLGRVYPTSRLAAVYKLKGGELITHIDGLKITRQTPIDSLLAGKIGKKIALSFLKDGVPQEAVITGLNYSQARDQWYTFKIEQSKALVNKLSDGKLGYIHIQAMGGSDWSKFYAELFRENSDKEALVIDVRGNYGGHIHDQIISLLQKKRYAYSTSRNLNREQRAEPRRAWDRPTIVLVNEDSFSDGEIFPTVYQELKLGKVVGIPSSGAVIGTWQYDLIDGSSMRMPGSGWYKLDGTNMEGTGAQPDIVVENLPEDVIAERDPQLERAVKELLKDLK